MKHLRLLLYPFLVIIFCSATTVHYSPADRAEVAVASISDIGKPNILQRALKLFTRKQQDEDIAKADRQAGTSLVLGISAFAAIGLGMAVPYIGWIMLAAIPLGIVAITMGSSAIRNNTTRDGAARTGRGLGIGALSTLAALLVLAVIAIAAWTGW